MSGLSRLKRRRRKRLYALRKKGNSIVRRLSKLDRDRIVGFQNGLCAYCGTPCSEPGLRTYDHVVPLAKGGPNARKNLVLSCQPCNRKKAASIQESWITRAVLILFARGEELAWLGGFEIDWARYTEP